MLGEILNKLDYLNESELKELQVAILSRLKLLERRKRLENQLKRFK